MGYSKGGDSKSNNRNTTVFPTEFLSGFENRYGRGVSLDELMGAMPGAQSIFGAGGSVQGAGGQTAALPGSPGGGGAGGSSVIPFDVLNSAVQGQFATGDPRQSAAIMAALQRQAGPGATGVTLDQLRAFRGQGSGLGGDAANYITAVLPAQLAQFTQGPVQRFGQQQGADLSALQIPESIRRLFGANAVPQAQAPTIRDPNQITAASAQAGLANIAPGGFDRYEQSLFRSLNDPVQRQLAQQGAVADRQQQAELAQAGLASSGAGLGQVQTARRQRAEQSMATAQQAASQASASRFGKEYEQEMFNAQQRQQTNLANAGFDQDAQKANAANMLSGDMARSEAYLKAIGLNQTAAQAMRQDFLGLLGITQKELERLEASQRSNIEMALNNWLQQGALLGNLGQRGSQRSSSSGGSGGGLTITGQSFS